MADRSEGEKLLQGRLLVSQHLEGLVRNYQREVERQKLLIKKVKPLSVI